MKSLHKLPLFGFALAACWLSPAYAQESIDSHEQHRTIWVHPNGVDDTSALQGALDSCSGIRCVIRLSAGVFHTAPLVANDFHGVMRGAGQHDTIVRALTDRVLHLSDANPFNSVDPTAAEPWPSLLAFIEGDVRLSHMTIDVPEGTITDGWWPVCADFEEQIPVLGIGVVVSNRLPMKFGMEYVSIVGAPSEDPLWRRTIINGVGALGAMLPPDFDDACTDSLPFRGEVALHSNRIVDVVAGTFLVLVEDAEIRITGNTYEGILGDGIEIADIHNSRAYVARNDVEVRSGAGIEMLQNELAGLGLPLFGGSDFVIANNRIKVLESAFAVVRYFDFVEGAPPNKLEIFGNHVEVTADTFIGVGVGQIDDVRIAKNTVVGASTFGAGVELSNGCRMDLNDFSGLTPQVTDLVLDETTSNCRVTAFNGDTMLDLGTNNKVIFR